MILPLHVANLRQQSHFIVGGPIPFYVKVQVSSLAFY